MMMAYDLERLSAVIMTVDEYFNNKDLVEMFGIIKTEDPIKYVTPDHSWKIGQKVLVNFMTNEVSILK